MVVHNIYYFSARMLVRRWMVVLDVIFVVWVCLVGVWLVVYTD